VIQVATFDRLGASTGLIVTGYSGNATTVRDQAGKQRRSITDGLGRLKSVDEMNEYPSTTVYATTSYDYDALDNLVHVAQGSQHRYFMYDSLSRLIRARNPEQNTNSALALADPLTGNSLWCVAYSYDANSNLATKTDPRSITTTYNYDALNRVTSRTYSSHPQNTPAVFYYYDSQALPSGAPSSFNRGSSKGRLVAVLYGSGTSSTGSYTGYDQLGRVIVSYQQIDGQNYGFSYGYNLAGAMTSQTYPSGRVVTTEYDAAGRIAGVKNQATGSYWAGAAASDSANRIQYSPHGAVSAMRLGNGLWEKTGFNSRLQPLQIKLGTSANPSSALQLDYGYGTTTNNGNVLSQTITIQAPGQNSTSFVQSYSYDQVNRLSSASETSGGQTWSQQFGYDRFGNMWVSACTGITLSQLTPQGQGAFNAANNRLIASQYDEAGNQIADGLNRAFTYDAENRQTSFNGATAQYSYDGDGRRVKKVDSTGTTVFVYNAGGQLIAEYHSDPVPPPAGGGGTSYLTTDHLGSTRVVTKSDGTVKARYDHLPFGEEINAGIGARTGAMGYGGADTTKQKFTQKERDSESGLDYFLARYYSPAQGRFTGPDSLLTTAKVTEPQSWNRYSYVTNNPLAYIDPDGHEGIVVSGQPSEKHTNKTHFLVNGLDRAKKLQAQYKKAGKGEKVTWFIYNSGGKNGYSNETVQQYKAQAEKAGINVQVVSDQQKIVDYVNEKSGGDSRSQDLVSNFTYIGHALKGDLNIGYGDWFDELDFEEFDPQSFSKDSVANLVGACNTAVEPGFFDFETSVADQFVDIVGGKVLASSVSVWFPGGVVSDQELVKTYRGKIVEKKGRGGRK
jgi:RHS repeat-associated protein